MVEKTTAKIIGWDSPVLIHPGEHLVDFIEDAEITQSELSKRIGLTKKAINKIVKGKAPITRNTAYRLSKVFSVTPDFWINIQNNYDASLARTEETERLEKEKEKYLPDFKETYKELSRIGMMPNLAWKQENLLEVTRKLQRYFGVFSLKYVEQGTMKFAWRKHSLRNVNNHTLAAWVQLGKIKAQNVEVSEFNKKKLKTNLPEIKALILKPQKEYLPRLEEILSECGVVLVYAPKMKNAPAQGAVKWIEGNKVLLILHTDNQYEDRFWFNLFHEIGHIILHGKRKVYINFDSNKERAEEEKEADNFAQKWLLPNIDDFLESLQEKDLKEAINEFAQKNAVTPAIVAGQLTHRFRNKDQRIYSAMNPFLKGRIKHTNLELDLI